MNMASILRIPLAILLVLTLVAGNDAATGQATRDAPATAEALPAGFASATAPVNGTILHYVAGGQGPPLILIHGFPENWSAFGKIMPWLASQYRVVAVDIRGIGGSKPTEHGYDAATMAEDVHQLAQTLGLDRPYIVGHDFGGWVAYALARLHPSTVRGAMVLDVPIPGIDPWEKVKADPRLWHFGFHRVPGLAEKLLAGREAIYFGYFLRRTAADPKAISDEDVERYARAHSRPGQMAAAMGMYRAIEENEKFGKERRGKLDVPLALIAGENSFGALLPTMAKGLEDAGAQSVAVDTIIGGGHYVLDTNPAEVAMLIERHATGMPPKKVR
jgi:pimeloyl-ACP methyl ester carboxylesterase